jgi:dephospho-CoA kinase
VIIGIAGRIGSGKTTIARYLVEKYNFKRLSYSAMLTDLFLATKGRSAVPTRRDLQNLGNQLTDAIGHAGLTALLLRAATVENIVIDGIRHPDSYQFLAQRYDTKFRLIFRDVPLSTRHILLNARTQSLREVSLVNFVEFDNHQAEINIEALKLYADLQLPFFDDIAQGYSVVDKFMHDLNKNNNTRQLS